MIDGRSGSWETVIGLEVHAQIVSNAKLFSGAATRFGAEPNTQVSPVDAAFPGMLPVINRHCVEQAVKTGLGLQAQINCTSVFDRKNYFYPDLPAGYQISQYSQPIVGHGRIVLDLPDGSTRTIGITRLHLEQDAGKSLHDQHPHWSCANCAPSCAISAPATAIWRKARCAATPMFRCGDPVPPMARAARSRT
jgi:aspartyl-tRNA(Asn)/glutamyl-tRNA(Gln) amidotransferase subunit B